MIINHNKSATNAHRNMKINNSSVSKSSEKLSSGLRINRAGDDAAGLSISEKMRGQIRGLDQASRNSQDGISLIQTAEGALQETQDVLHRMRELSVQAANDTNASADRDAIGDELGQLGLELSRIMDNTEFNEQKLLDGTTSGGLVNIQVGANENQLMELDFTKDGVDLTTVVMGVGGVGGLTRNDIDPTAKATALIGVVDKHLKTVSSGRSQLGAYQNALEHSIKNLDNSSENLTASESRIRDVDMAKEMMNYSKANVLEQSSQAMIAQANQQPQAVLQLLK